MAEIHLVTAETIGDNAADYLRRIARYDPKSSEDLLSPEFLESVPEALNLAFRLNPKRAAKDLESCDNDRYDLAVYESQFHFLYNQHIEAAALKSMEIVGQKVIDLQLAGDEPASAASLAEFKRYEALLGENARKARNYDRGGGISAFTDAFKQGKFVDTKHLAWLKINFTDLDPKHEKTAAEMIEMSRRFVGQQSTAEDIIFLYDRYYKEVQPGSIGEAARKSQKMELAGAISRNLDRLGLKGSDIANVTTSRGLDLCLSIAHLKALKEFDAGQEAIGASIDVAKQKIDQMYETATISLARHKGR